MSKSTEISFEFFPPRDGEGRERLVANVASRLAELNPAYFSVTYGAGGSTRDGTAQTVAALLAAGQQAVPHLSMGNDEEASIHELLTSYRDMGVQKLVALRGDQPSGMGGDRFSNNAQALIECIRRHSGDHFDLIVAAYPEAHPDSAGAAADLDFFKRKVDAGASKAITQYFYNVDAYADFMERSLAAGITLPIVPGIMPITNLQSLVRFSDGCGAEIPRWLYKRLVDLEDDEAATRELGIEFLSTFCERLLALGAPGLHFYTLNRWGATVRICENLALA